MAAIEGLIGITESEYTKRVEAFVAGQAVTGPCAKCNGTGRFEWVSAAAATQGQLLNGACRRCNGKGFTTVRDNENNASYETWNTQRIERARQLVARAEGNESNTEAVAV